MIAMLMMCGTFSLSTALHSHMHTPHGVYAFYIHMYNRNYYVVVDTSLISLCLFNRVRLLAGFGTPAFMLCLSVCSTLFNAVKCYGSMLSLFYSFICGRMNLGNSV